MAQLILETINRAEDKKQINGEWLLLHNESETPFNAEGCSITVSAGGARPRTVTTLKAGLIIQPKEKVRLVSGAPGKKSQGEAPKEEKGVRNFHLFLKVPYVTKNGSIVRLVNRQQVEICKARFSNE